MYDSTRWKDRIVSAETGAVLQEGTDQNAANFNSMEHGISDHHVAMAMTQITRSNRCLVTYVPSNLVATQGRGLKKSVNYGDKYIEDIKLEDGGAIKAAAVTMNGMTLAGSATISGGGNTVRVYIPQVTGDIVIKLTT